MAFCSSMRLFCNSRRQDAIAVDVLEVGFGAVKYTGKDGNVLGTVVGFKRTVFRVCEDLDFIELQS